MIKFRDDVTLARVYFSISFQGAVSARLSQFSNQFTAYSSYVIEVKRGRMIPDISPHNRSASVGFSVYPRRRCGARLLKFVLDSQPTVRIRLSWNLVGSYQSSIRSIALRWIFAISFQGARLFKSLNRFIAYCIHPIELEFCRILTMSPRNLAERDFSISSQEVLWGGTPLVIFKSIHSLQFLCGWVETWHDNTRHHSLQLLYADIDHSMNWNLNFMW